MSFFLLKCFELATEPGTVLLALAGAGTALIVLRARSRWGRRLVIAGVGGLVGCAVLPLGTWMMRPLEDRFPPLRPLPAHVDGIIVLGGAVDIARSVDRHTPVFNDAAGRMTAFAALALHYPEARLVFTGGNGGLFAGKTTEADVAREFYRSLGIDPRRFIFEDASHDTRQNALFTRRMVTPRPGQTWLLVTSAADMPRAVGCFREVGWPVVAYPSDYHTMRHGSGFAPGLVDGVRDVNWAAHEWLGLVYYRLRGWTPSLFPGPAA